MPRATRPTSHRSKFFPKRLELITVDSADEPELGRGPHRMLISMGYTAWRLYRARQRAKKAKELGDDLRDEILDRYSPLFDGVYGFRVIGRRSIEVLVTDQHSDTIIDPSGVIRHLGEHASDVVKGIVFPIEKILSDPTNFSRVVKLIQDEFGPEIAGEVTITLNRDILHKLVKAGVVEDLPENVFQRVVGSKQVRVKMLEPK